MSKAKKTSGKKSSQQPAHASDYDYEESGMVTDPAQPLATDEAASETTRMLPFDGVVHPGSESARSSRLLILWDMMLCRSDHRPPRHKDAEAFAGETALLRWAVIALVACFLLCTSAFIISASVYGLDTDDYDSWIHGKMNISSSRDVDARVASADAAASMMAMDRIETFLHNITGEG